MVSIQGVVLFAVLIILLLLIYAATCIRNVPQAKAYVIEMFGKYRTTWHAGFHAKFPFIERVAQVVNLNEQDLKLKSQAIITKDNVEMDVDSAVFFQITDPYRFTYVIQKPFLELENLTLAKLRSVLNGMEIDKVLSSRDLINTKMRASLNKSTESWGIKVNRVEVKMNVRED